MEKFNRLNSNNIVFFTWCMLFFVVIFGLFTFASFDNHALAGGPVGGLIPSDPISIGVGSLIPGFDDLYCTVNPGETWVAGQLGYDICSSSGSAIYSATDNSSDNNGSGSTGGGVKKETCTSCLSVCKTAAQEATPFCWICHTNCPTTPSCTSDCTCAASTCVGSTCSDGCGGSCAGTKGASCPNNANFCQGVVHPSSNGCGSCIGTKKPAWSKTCLYSDTGNVCNQTNCNQTITIKSAYCINVPNNGCGSQYTLPISQCSSFISCHDQQVTCPPCSWKEVAP